MKWETVIGLEVHAELLTESKLFCSCSAAFGGEPNSRCCPVCTGMPGTLPVLNRQAVELAVKAGLGLHCQIEELPRFDRKNYFYPDLPKAYQISQLYAPLCKNGYLTLPLSGEPKIRIHEIHLEEDAGKLIHGERNTFCDFNRCGVPLIEIVTEPDMHSGAEAAVFVRELRNYLRILGISDGKMQEGSLRVDVNLSVRPAGSRALGVRTEMKNLSSFRSVQRAAEEETRRQIERLEQGEEIRQETRRWDETEEKTFPMRTKEEAADYRYFPEPDLPALRLEKAWIHSVAQSLPDLPEAYRQNWAALGIPREQRELLLGEPDLTVFFTEVLSCGANPRTAVNWILEEVRRILDERNILPEEMRLCPEDFVKLLELLEGGTVNRDGARQTLGAIFDGTVSPESYIQERGLEQISDGALLTRIAKQVVNENTKATEDFYAGKEKALGFLMGQCMRKLQGKGAPEAVRTVLLELLNRER